LSICKSINRAKGDQFVYSLGKDGRNAYIFFPLWVMDTMIPTYDGETPPNICQAGPLPLTPQRERKQFKLDEHPNALWTFVYFNAYIDLILWELANVPAYNHASMARILSSPLRVILCHADAIECSPIEAYVEVTITRTFAFGDTESEETRQQAEREDWESAVESMTTEDMDWQSMIDYSEDDEEMEALRKSRRSWSLSGMFNINLLQCCHNPHIE